MRAETGFDQRRGFGNHGRGDVQIGPVAQQSGAFGVTGSLRSAAETKMRVAISSTIGCQMP